MRFTLGFDVVLGPGDAVIAVTGRLKPRYGALVLMIAWGCHGHLAR